MKRALDNDTTTAAATTKKPAARLPCDNSTGFQLLRVIPPVVLRHHILCHLTLSELLAYRLISATENNFALNCPELWPGRDPVGWIVTRKRVMIRKLCNVVDQYQLKLNEVASHVAVSDFRDGILESDPGNLWRASKLDIIREYRDQMQAAQRRLHEKCGVIYRSSRYVQLSYLPILEKEMEEMDAAAVEEKKTKA